MENRRTPKLDIFDTQNILSVIAGNGRLTTCSNRHVNYGVCLKDLQKFIAKNDDKNLYTNEKRFVDRLIKKYKATTPVSLILSLIEVENKERKKETAEVDGSTETGDQTHGGDSQSGEVEEGESGKGENNNENQNLQDSESEGGSDSTDTIGNSQNDSSDEPGTAGDQNEAEAEIEGADNPGRDGQGSDRVEGTGEDGSSHGTEGEPEKALPNEDPNNDCVNSKNKDATYTEASSGGNTGQTAGSVEEVSQDDPIDNQPAGEMVPDSLIEESNQECAGGNYLTPDGSASIPFRTAKRLKKRLEDMIKDAVVGVEETSPRISGKKLIAELKTKRYNLNRIRKQDQQKKPVLLAIDVSGSCKVNCNYTLEVAVAIAKEMPDVCKLLIHSNGEPQTEADMKYYGNDIKGVKNVKDWFEEDWSMCLAWGDKDAEEQLNEIGKKCKTMLFDDYCVNSGEINIKNQPHSTYTWCTGVRGADGTLTALNLTQKGG